MDEGINKYSTFTGTDVVQARIQARISNVLLNVAFPCKAILDNQMESLHASSPRSAAGAARSMPVRADMPMQLGGSLTREKAASVQNEYDRVRQHDDRM